MEARMNDKDEDKVTVIVSGGYAPDEFTARVDDIYDMLQGTQDEVYDLLMNTPTNHALLLAKAYDCLNEALEQVKRLRAD
jgi:hypothetical protein